MTTDTDPVARLQARSDTQQETSAKLTAARRTLTALQSPAVDNDVTWEHHWAATAAIESEIADLYQHRADLDPADTEAAACAAHYRMKAATSSEWAGAAKPVQS